MDEYEYDLGAEIPNALQPELCRLRANNFLERDEPELALEQMATMLKLPDLKVSTRLEALVANAAILIKLKQLGLARLCLQFVLASPEVTDELRRECLLRLPDAYESAQDQLVRWHETLNSSLLDPPRRGGALYFRHKVHHQLGDLASATADLLAALAIPELTPPDRVECQLALADLFMYQNRYAEAAELLEQAVTEVSLDLSEAGVESTMPMRASYHYRARIHWARAYIALGRLSEVRSELAALQSYATLDRSTETMYDQVAQALRAVSPTGAPHELRQ